MSPRPEDPNSSSIPNQAEEEQKFITQIGEVAPAFAYGRRDSKGRLIPDRNAADFIAGKIMAPGLKKEDLDSNNPYSQAYQMHQLQQAARLSGRPEIPEYGTTEYNQLIEATRDEVEHLLEKLRDHAARHPELAPEIQEEIAAHTKTDPYQTVNDIYELNNKRTRLNRVIGSANYKSDILEIINGLEAANLLENVQAARAKLERIPLADIDNMLKLFGQLVMDRRAERHQYNARDQVGPLVSKPEYGRPEEDYDKAPDPEAGNLDPAVVEKTRRPRRSKAEVMQKLARLVTEINLLIEKEPDPVKQVNFRSRVTRLVEVRDTYQLERFLASLRAGTAKFRQSH